MKYKLNNWEWGVRSEEWGCCDWQNTASVRPYAPGRAGPGGRRRRWVQSPVKWQPSGGVHQYSTQYTIVHQCSQCRTVTSSWLLKLRVMCEAPRWQAAWPGYQESSAELSRVSPAVRSQVFQHNSEILSQTSDRPGHHGAAPLCHFISRHHSR